MLVGDRKGDRKAQPTIHIRIAKKGRHSKATTHLSAHNHVFRWLQRNEAQNKSEDGNTSHQFGMSVGNIRGVVHEVGLVYCITY